MIVNKKAHHCILRAITGHSSSSFCFHATFSFFLNFYSIYIGKKSKCFTSNATHKGTMTFAFYMQKDGIRQKPDALIAVMTSFINFNQYSKKHCLQKHILSNDKTIWETANHSLHYHLCNNVSCDFASSYSFIITFITYFPDSFHSWSPY